jgi:hypothetical protein
MSQLHIMFLTGMDTAGMATVEGTADMGTVMEEVMDMTITDMDMVATVMVMTTAMEEGTVTGMVMDMEDITKQIKGRLHKMHINPRVSYNQAVNKFIYSPTTPNSNFTAIIKSSP